MLVCICDPERYVRLGATGWHASCEENFFKVAGELGWDYPHLPQSISWFTHIPIAADGALSLAPSPSRPGDSVVLRATMDCDVIVCSCAQDITEINGFKPTPLWLDLSDEEFEEASARAASNEEGAA
jgi:uncharacterized protein